MYDLIVMVGQFILALSILVAIHELGHMLPALWFGMRVEKFYIGFPPKVFSFVRKGIEYGLGAIPLGGFVKISGMVDESLDTDNLDKTPQPWEFRSKPAWQRLIVMLGGVTVNIVFGILMVAVMLWAWGTAKVPISEVKNGIVANKTLQGLGFKTGDNVLAINHKPVKYLSEILSPVSIIDSDAVYTVQRNGEVLDLKVPVETLNKLDSEEPFMFPRSELYVDTVIPNNNAFKAGIVKNDKIISVNNIPVKFLDELSAILKNNSSKKVNIGLVRNIDTLILNANVSEAGKLGFVASNKIAYKQEFEKYSLSHALIQAPVRSWDMIYLNLKAFKQIFAGKINPMKSVGGPIKIAQLFGTHFVLEKFCTLLAMISLMLAFMNLLPVPALDGGHVLFLIYELITNRKPSDKVVEIAQKSGMVLLLTLSVLVFIKDIFEIKY